jgi:hypothetical protein
MVLKHSFIAASSAAIALTSLMLASGSAQASFNSYAAKFVCGSRAGDSSVVRGTYETSVNIHNPHLIPIQFAKKAAIANPQSSTRGPISPFRSETLGPDQALGVNCRDIRALYPTGVVLPAFIEGFLVIHIDSTIPIDVVEVLTARHRGAVVADFSNEVETIHTRQVNPIRVILPTVP